MHPLFQAQGLWALIISTACLALALPSRADEGKAAEKPPVRIIEKPSGKTGKPRPPERVALPAEGEHAAEDLLAIAGVLSGRTVRLDGERVRATRVKISRQAAGVEVTLDELKILLAAFQVYLFEVTDDKEGEILVASRDPTWTEEAPRQTRIVDVGSAGFKAAWERIQAVVKEWNGRQPKGPAAKEVFAVPDERTGKVILGSSSAGALEEVLGKVDEGREKAEKDPDRSRYYAYTGNFRRATDLEKELLEKLGDADRNLLRVTVSTRGNRLLFRTPPRVWEKVEGILKELDRKPETR